MSDKISFLYDFEAKHGSIDVPALRKQMAEAGLDEAAIDAALTVHCYGETCDFARPIDDPTVYAVRTPDGRAVFGNNACISGLHKYFRKEGWGPEVGRYMVATELLAQLLRERAARVVCVRLYEQRDTITISNDVLAHYEGLLNSGDEANMESLQGLLMAGEVSEAKWRAWEARRDAYRVAKEMFRLLAEECDALKLNMRRPDQWSDEDVAKLINLDQFVQAQRTFLQTCNLKKQDINWKIDHLSPPKPPPCPIQVVKTLVDGDLAYFVLDRLHAWQMVKLMHEQNLEYRRATNQPKKDDYSFRKYRQLNLHDITNQLHWLANQQARRKQFEQQQHDSVASWADKFANDEKLKALREQLDRENRHHRQHRGGSKRGRK